MSNSFLKGFLFGSVVAGAVTLLTTPRSGKENRERLLDYVDDTAGLVGDVKGNVSALQDAVSTLGTEGVSLVKEVSEEISTTLKEFSHDIAPHLRRIKEDSEQLTEDLAQFESETTKEG